MTDATTTQPHPHEARPDLKHLQVVAGMSPVTARVTLDGQPWAGLVSLNVKVEADRLCVVTAQFYANLDIDAELRVLTMTNAKLEG